MFFQQLSLYESTNNHSIAATSCLWGISYFGIFGQSVSQSFTVSDQVPSFLYWGIGQIILGWAISCFTLLYARASLDMPPKQMWTTIVKEIQKQYFILILREKKTRRRKKESKTNTDQANTIFIIVWKMPSGNTDLQHRCFVCFGSLRIGNITEWNCI